MGFPTKNDHFGVFWGYHNLRKHPYGCQLLLTRKSLVKHRSYWLICRILVCIHLSSGYLIRDIQQMNILSYFSSRNTFLYTRVKVDATVYIYISPVLTYLLGTVFSHVLWPFSRNQIFLFWVSLARSCAASCRFTISSVRTCGGTPTWLHLFTCFLLVGDFEEGIIRKQGTRTCGCTPNVGVGPMVFILCSFGILGDYNP